MCIKQSGEAGCRGVPRYSLSGAYPLFNLSLVGLDVLLATYQYRFSKINSNIYLETSNPGLFIASGDFFNGQECNI